MSRRWGQNLLHHPHLDCVVPGGGFSPDGTQWIACKPGFFLPVRVLSRLFRRLFLQHVAESSKVATATVERMAKLWQVEETIRSQSPEARVAVRQQTSAALVTELF